jgi:hypothetical protein
MLQSHLTGMLLDAARVEKRSEIFFSNPDRAASAANPKVWQPPLADELVDASDTQLQAFSGFLYSQHVHGFFSLDWPFSERALTSFLKSAQQTNALRLPSANETWTPSRVFAHQTHFAHLASFTVTIEDFSNLQNLPFPTYRTRRTGCDERPRRR